MTSYGKFSKLYDLFMETDYEKWTGFIVESWKKENKNTNLVLDLGCGTGIITNMLHQKGYDMIGIDSSTEMLSVAQERAELAKADILYLHQDMREFELYGTVDSILCLCDSLNYMLSEKDLAKVFKLVHNYLNPRGTFIFDMNTEHKYHTVLSSNNFSDVLDNAAYIWENYYDADGKINEYIIHFFAENEGTGLYERFSEEHYQRAYSTEEIKSIIHQSGLTLKGIYDDYEFKDIDSLTERAVFVCQKMQ